MKRNITFLFLTLSLFSCNKDEDILTKNYDLEGFHTVELNSVFEVVLEEDQTFQMKIETNPTNIENVKFEVIDSVLVLKNERKLKWKQPSEAPIKILIKSKPLKRVNAKETCNITTANPITSDEFGLVVGSKANQANLDLNCNVFFYWNSFPCGGKITLQGKTNELKLWNTALMVVDAKNLTTDFALVENNSKGICEVNVTNKLEYLISGKGNINLYGNPPEIIQKQPNDGGKLIQF